MRGRGEALGGHGSVRLGLGSGSGGLAMAIGWAAKLGAGPIWQANSGDGRVSTKMEDTAMTTCSTTRRLQFCGGE